MQQAAAPAFPDRVPDGIAADGACGGGGQGRSERDALLGGEHAAEQHRDLTGDDQADESGGFQQRQGEDDRQCRRTVQREDVPDKVTD